MNTEQDKETLRESIIDLLQYADARSLRIIKAFVFPLVQKNIIEHEK